MEDIKLTLDEVVNYFQQVYPKEFEITILTLQNQKLIKLLEERDKEKEVSE